MADNQQTVAKISCAFGGLLGLSMHVASRSSGMGEFERGMWDVVEKESGGEDWDRLSGES